MHSSDALSFWSSGKSALGFRVVAALSPPDMKGIDQRKMRQPS